MRSHSASPAANRHAPDRTELCAGLIDVGSFRCPVSHPQFHAHRPTNGFCFVFPRHAVWIQHDGGEPFVADATVVPLYNPTRPYRRRAIGGQSDHTDWFGVAPGLLREMVAAFDPTVRAADVELFRFDSAPSSAAMYLEQRIVFTRVRAGACDPLYVEEKGIELLGQVLAAVYGRPASALASSERRRRLAEDTRALVARAAHERLSLAAVARALGTSPFHLCRVFKAHTGRTIQGYRSQLRLRRSLAMLVDERRDVLDVAVSLGYSSHSHFTRAFRAAFGLTPSAFRGLAEQPAGTEVRDRVGAILAGWDAEPG
jgi:AraC-like DNA-binding protein